MLDGRNDLEPLTYFVKSMEDFSDDGETLWGAYGWRWRSYFNKDQIAAIIGLLKDNPPTKDEQFYRCGIQKRFSKNV